MRKELVQFLWSHTSNRQQMNGALWVRHLFMGQTLVYGSDTCLLRQQTKLQQTKAIWQYNKNVTVKDAITWFSWAQMTIRKSNYSATKILYDYLYCPLYISMQISTKHGCTKGFIVQAERFQRCQSLYFRSSCDLKIATISQPIRAFSQLPSVELIFYTFH